METARQVETCRRRVRQRGVRDVLVQGDGSDEEEVTADEVEAVLAVNLKGAFSCARESLRHFLEQEKAGVIVNISSVHQLIPKPRFIGYSMSKGGMQNLTRTLALKYAGRSIRVNAVAPGATVTPINRGWAEDPNKRAEVERHIPMGRPAGFGNEQIGTEALFRL